MTQTFSGEKTVILYISKGTCVKAMPWIMYSTACIKKKQCAVCWELSIESSTSLNAGKVEPHHVFMGLFTDTHIYGRIAILRYGLYGPMPYRKLYRKMTAERPEGTGTVLYIRHPYPPYVRGQWASLGSHSGHSDDTTKISDNIIRLSTKDLTEETLLPTLKKYQRGFNHIHTGRLLCHQRWLHEFEKDPACVQAFSSSLLIDLVLLV